MKTSTKKNTPIIPANPFVLVDGSSYLFRAYHALPPLTTSNGQPTGAIYGVISMLRKLIQDYQPENMVVVFDSKEKNFRHALYEPYKANRLVMPDDLQKQIQPLFELIKAMGLPLLVVPGVEADDIIGTLAKQAKERGMFTLISTGDKDFAQLVEEKIFLINTMSQDIIDRARVIEKFEIKPEQIIDYLALVGDSVDNIPGIPGVGPKTAVKWINTYGDLENIIKNAQDIPGKVGEAFRAHLDKIPLFRSLLAINVQVDLSEYQDDFLKRKEPESDALKVCYKKLEFKNWLREIEKISLDTNHVIEEIQSHTREDKSNLKIAPQYTLIQEAQALIAYLQQVHNTNLLAFHLATIAAGEQEKILGLALSTQAHQAIFVPINSSSVAGELPLETRPGLELSFVINAIKPLLENASILKIAYHLKKEAKLFLQQGILIQNALDTMLASYVLHSSGKHDLGKIVYKYLDQQHLSLEDHLETSKKQNAIQNLSFEEQCQLFAQVCDLNLQAHLVLQKKLQEFPPLKDVFEKIEMPLLNVLLKMETTGVLIDVDILKKHSEDLGARLHSLETQAFELAVGSFNLNSPKQLQQVLYTDLQLPVLEKTPTGQPSTSEACLQKLADNYPLPKIILEYRSLSKLKSTYTDSLPLQVDPISKRIHTNYQQAITSTGRLSSINPNLQNIPIRNPEGHRIRSAFIAKPGYKIVTADYSQIELRIMAHLAQEQALIQAFSKNEDVHTSTAAAVFNVAPEAVSSEMRRQAKIINFGLLYGMSAFGLGKQLGMEKEQADQTIKRYFDCFPGLRNFIDNILLEAREKGYVETLFGRRLYLPDLKSPNMMLRKAAERAAINAPMQGSNADIIKLAMIKLDQALQDKDADMLLQVHDELIFEIKESALGDVIPVIKDIMENIVILSVPLCINIGIGNNWEAADLSP